MDTPQVRNPHPGRGQNRPTAPPGGGQEVAHPPQKGIDYQKIFEMLMLLASLLFLCWGVVRFFADKQGLDFIPTVAALTVFYVVRGSQSWNIDRTTVIGFVVMVLGGFIFFVAQKTSNVEQRPLLLDFSIGLIGYGLGFFTAPQAQSQGGKK